MKIFFLLYILLGISPTIGHDIAIAIFDFSSSDNTVFLNINFNKTDIELAIGYKKENRETIPTLIQEYINDHFSLQINGEICILHFDQIEQIKDHWHITARTKKPYKKIKNIVLENTCLIKEVENHSNVIYFNLNHTDRGFRMNKSRTNISLDY